MSKIAEKKAFEACPPHYQQLAGDGYYDMSLERREGYIKGYEQAMQDFLEYLKYCSTFTDMNGKTIIDNDLHNILIEQFKNYMEEGL